MRSKKMPLIFDRVQQARIAVNPKVICKMKSGWVVIGDVQFLPGYCLLLPDPVVPSLNHLDPGMRIQFLSDMTLIGDALLEVTKASRINYEILGNTEPELHAHIFPRFDSEPDDKKRMPAWFYDWENARRFSFGEHGELLLKIKGAIQRHLVE